MADIQPGYTYGDAPNNVINAANLNQHVANSVILPEFISAKLLKDPAALSDAIVINDGGVLKKITLQQVKALLNDIPTGVIMDFSGASEPDGWLFCGGQEISRTAYAALFSAIGTVYGEGNGSSTFNVPDLRGRVAAGKDNMGGTTAGRLTSTYGPAGTALAAAGGSQSHTLVLNEIPAHSHFMTNMPIFTGGSGIASGTGYVFSPAESTYSGGSFPHANVQPTLILNKIIRYR